MKEEVVTKSDVDLLIANSLFMDFAGVVFCPANFRSSTKRLVIASAGSKRK